MKFKKTGSFYDSLFSFEKKSQPSKECFHNVDRCTVITHQAMTSYKNGLSPYHS